VFVDLRTNLTPIVAGDDITIAIHPDWWALPTTLGYSISALTREQHTIASYVLPITTEYDWTVDIVGQQVVFQVTTLPIPRSAFSDPVLILPAAAELTTPEEGQVLSAGSPFTFSWTQTPPRPTNYRLRFSTDGAQTFPQLGGLIPGTADSVTRTIPASATDSGLVRLEGIFPGFDPIFNEPIAVQTTTAPVIHVGTPPPWHIGENGTVNWTVAGQVDHYKVELTRNGSQSWTTLADNLPGAQHRLTVGVDPPVSDNCHVRVHAIGPDGSTTATSGRFHIVGSPPHRGGRNPRD
jgi:hypothetical protein